MGTLTGTRGRVVGGRQVAEKLARIARAGFGGAVEGVTQVVLEIRKRAVPNTPIVLGNLRATAYGIYPQGDMAPDEGSFIGPQAGAISSHHDDVKSQGARETDNAGFDKVTGIVGFSAPYAAAVHENPRAGKTGKTRAQGRKKAAGGGSQTGAWKFLERAVMDTADMAPQEIGKAMRVRQKRESKK